MAKGGFSCPAKEETQYQLKTPRVEVKTEMKQGVEFTGCRKVMATVERHPATVCGNQTDGCLTCHNATALNPQTHWRCI